MAAIINTIDETGFQGITVKKLTEHATYEVVLITLKKGEKIPPHVANRDAQLIMLEGQIRFFIKEMTYDLQPHQVLSFGKEIQHSVTATMNSKFVLVK